MTIYKPHYFSPSYYIINDYEVRPFLFFFKRRVKVGSNIKMNIRCGICGRLEVEHKIMYPDLYKN